LSVVNHNHHYQTLMHLLNDLRGFRLGSSKDEAKGEGKAGVIQPEEGTPTRHSGARFSEGPTTAGLGCRAYAVLPQNALQVGFPQLLGATVETTIGVFISKNATCSPYGSTLCTTNGATRMVSLT
jgi:hypothetical protein